MASLSPATSPTRPSPDAAAVSGSPSTSPPAGLLPSLPVEFPPDHPVSRRAAALEASRQAALQRGEEPGKVDPNDALGAHLLARHSLPLSIPGSPAEVARRLSIQSSSRRGSILAIPPVDPQKPVHLEPGYLPKPGDDAKVDQKEIEKEIEEIDTFG